MKRLAIIAAAVCTLGLSACGPSGGQVKQTVTEFCAEHGGVAKVEYTTEKDFLDPSYYSAECVDGSKIE